MLLVSKTFHQRDNIWIQIKINISFRIFATVSVITIVRLASWISDLHCLLTSGEVNNKF